MRPAVLALNAGSTSLKFALFGLAADGGPPAELLRGRLEADGAGERVVLAATSGTAGGQPAPLVIDGQASASIADAPGLLFEAVDRWCTARGLRLAAAGHRIVHGGREFTTPVRIDRSILDRLVALAPLAPLHQPVNLAPIRAIAGRRPELVQVGCFDTAFHATIPERARVYGLPRSHAERGRVRYGFHGLACESVMRRLGEREPRLAAGRVLIAHLGGGASLTAVSAGRSVHHSMGWSALDGLVMATRCGSLDPALVLDLVRDGGGPDAVERMLYRESGLLGLSGLSGDMRTLLESDDPLAAFAVDVFVHRVVVEAGAAISAMGGIDVLAFSGGIGEHASAVRERVVEGLNWIGASIDRGSNARGGWRIDADHSAVAIRRVAVDEEAILAEAAQRILAGAVESEARSERP
jgi:acetate kinase